MVSPFQRSEFVSACARTSKRLLGTSHHHGRKPFGLGLGFGLLLGVMVATSMWLGSPVPREYPSSRAELRANGNVQPALPSIKHDHSTDRSSPTCQALRGAGFQIPTGAPDAPDACSHLPVPAQRIDNDEYAICARKADNLMDNHLRADRGYWPDCREIFEVLDKDAAPVPAGITPQSPVPTKGLVVDVGANVGSCTMWLASRGYEVVSFEPKPIHIAMVKASASLNANIGRRITLHGMGLSDKPASGVALVSESTNSGNSWIMLGGEPAAAAASSSSSSKAIGGIGASTVSTDTGIALGRLDDFCGEPIEIMKIDTQGFELHVLRGAARLLRQGVIRRIKLEFWPFGLRQHGSDPVQLLELLHTHGYALSVGGNALQPTGFRALVDKLCVSDDQPGCAMHHVDVVAIREAKR